MTALEALHNIKSDNTLRSAKMKFCLVSSNKHPLKLDGTNARPNHVEDFVDLDELEKASNLEQYAGLGVSIQASNITAIDVDKCFSVPFELESADDRAIDVIRTFMDVAYIEFSFSGRGLRVFYRQPEIEDYSSKYYTKAEQYGIEYYQPSCSFRYVTITGRTIVSHSLESSESFRDTIETFLNKYMKKKAMLTSKPLVNLDDSLSLDELMKNVKKLYLKNNFFQDRWFDTEHLFSNIPGRSQESHHDYQLLALIYENITHDRNKVKYVFEQSPYFKSKDYKHMQKWTKNDYRYFNFQFDSLISSKGVK